MSKVMTIREAYRGFRAMGFSAQTAYSKAWTYRDHVVGERAIASFVKHMNSLKNN